MANSEFRFWSSECLHSSRCCKGKRSWKPHNQALMIWGSFAITWVSPLLLRLLKCQKLLKPHSSPRSYASWIWQSHSGETTWSKVQTQNPQLEYLGMHFISSITKITCEPFTLTKEMFLRHFLFKGRRSFIIKRHKKVNTLFCLIWYKNSFPVNCYFNRIWQLMSKWRYTQMWSKMVLSKNTRVAIFGLITIAFS